MVLREEELERAVMRLEERIRELLSKALGHRASALEIVVEAVYSRGRLLRLRVDVKASRRGFKGIGDLVDAVIERAVKEFERELEEGGLRAEKAHRGG